MKDVFLDYIDALKTNRMTQAITAVVVVVVLVILYNVLGK